MRDIGEGSNEIDIVYFGCGAIDKLGLKVKIHIPVHSYICQMHGPMMENHE